MKVLVAVAATATLLLLMLVSNGGVVDARVIPAAHLQAEDTAKPKIVRHVHVARPHTNWLDDVERFTTRIQKRESLLDKDTESKLSNLHHVHVPKMSIMDELRFEGIPSIPTVDSHSAGEAPKAASSAAPAKGEVDTLVHAKVEAEKESEKKDAEELKKDLPKLADLIAHLKKLQAFEDTGKLAEMSREELLKLEKELASMVPMIAHFRKEVSQKEANKLQNMENKIEEKKAEIKKEEAEEGTLNLEKNTPSSSSASSSSSISTVSSNGKPFDIHAPELIVAGVMQPVVTNTVTPVSGNTAAATVATPVADLTKKNTPHGIASASTTTTTTTTTATASTMTAAKSFPSKVADLTKKNTPHGIKKVFLQEETQEHVAPIPLV